MINIDLSLQTYGQQLSFLHRINKGSYYQAVLAQKRRNIGWEAASFHQEGSMLMEDPLRQWLTATESHFLRRISEERLFTMMDKL